MIDDDKPPSDRVWWRCTLLPNVWEARNKTALATGKLGHEPRASVLFVFSQTAYRAWMAARVFFQCELQELDMEVRKYVGGPEFKGKRTYRGQVAGVMSVWPEEILEGRRLSPKQRGDVWEAAQRGDSIASIAKHFGITEQRVRRLAKGKRR